MKKVVSKIWTGNCWEKLTPEVELTFEDIEEFCSKILQDVNIENGTGKGTLQQKGYNNDDREVLGAVASGDGAVAFGGQRYDKTDKPQTEAKGKQSFAQGGSVVVEGDWSAGFGKDSRTFQKAAFAQGGGTQAGDPDDSPENYSFAHAEGETTKAVGRGSHAEGCGTVTNGWHSHGEGVRTKTTSSGTHAEGIDTTAGLPLEEWVETHPDYTSIDLGALEHPAHAEGYATKATGYAAHAEGGNTVASNNYAHAEGASTVADGLYAHAEGESAEATARGSHAEGYETLAKHDYTHAEGYCTRTGRTAQHVCGMYNEGLDSTLLEVGNGNAKERKNAFEVKDDNSISIIFNGQKVSLQELLTQVASGGGGGNKLYMNTVHVTLANDVGFVTFTIYSQKPLKVEDLYNYASATFIGKIAVEDYTNNEVYNGIATVQIYPFSANELMFAIIGFGNSGGSVIAISRMENLTNDKITVYSVEV